MLSWEDRARRAEAEVRRLAEIIKAIKAYDESGEEMDGIGHPVVALAQERDDLAKEVARLSRALDGETQLLIKAVGKLMTISRVINDG